MAEFFNSTLWKSTLLPIVSALLILVIGIIVKAILSKTLVKILKKSKLDSMLHKFIEHTLSIALWVIIIIEVLNKLGIDSTSIITILAACGAAIALALQGFLSNLASGIIIMISHPFKSGDYIISSGAEGTVKSIDLLHTTIITADNRSVTIPNASLTGNTVTNVTASGNRRAEINIGISYNANIEDARKALLGLVNSYDQVIKDPAAACDVIEYADSGIILFLRYWLKPADFDLRFEINNKIKGALDNAGVEIPFPQVDVHIKNN